MTLHRWGPAFAALLTLTACTTAPVPATGFPPDSNRFPTIAASRVPPSGPPPGEVRVDPAEWRRACVAAAQHARIAAVSEKVGLPIPTSDPAPDVLPLTDLAADVDQVARTAERNALLWYAGYVDAAHPTAVQVREYANGLLSADEAECDRVVADTMARLYLQAAKLRQLAQSPPVTGQP